jgi:hypothetical protein
MTKITPAFDFDTKSYDTYPHGIYTLEDGRSGIIFQYSRREIVDVGTCLVQFANQHFLNTLDDLGLELTIDLTNRTNARLYKNSFAQVLITFLRQRMFGNDIFFYLNESDVGDNQLKLIKSCFSLTGVEIIRGNKSIDGFYEDISDNDATTMTLIDLHCEHNKLNTSSSIKTMKKKAKGMGLNHLYDEILQDRDNKVIFN